MKSRKLSDIMILPSLCEILGITADALLEVSVEVKKESCMESLSRYAREVGEIKASFEALQACSAVSSDHKGSAQMSASGIRINNTPGLGIVIAGREMMHEVVQIPFPVVKCFCELLGKEENLKVISVLDFECGRSEKDVNI